MLIYIRIYGEISYDVTIHHYSTTYSLLLAIVAASAVPLSPQPASQPASHKQATMHGCWAASTASLLGIMLLLHL
jgi:hypothetical protein